MIVTFLPPSISITAMLEAELDANNNTLAGAALADPPDLGAAVRGGRQGRRGWSHGGGLR